MAEVLQLNVDSGVEDVPPPQQQQQGKRLSDVDLASRKAEEASLRRYEAAGWLRKMAGVVAGKDLPAQPSEEEFRLGLRSGIILCNVLNKVQPGAVQKVIEAPSDTVIIPDGAALSAYQYFENVRNFLVAIEEMAIPTFEASDLEQGGKSSRIVNCILALRSYSDWKVGGGNGLWKLGGSIKASSGGKQFVRRHSDLFVNSISRNSSVGEKSLISMLTEQNSMGDLGHDTNEMDTSSTHILVNELLSDKKREDIPMIVENMLRKLMEEFELRLASQSEKIRMVGGSQDVSDDIEPLGKDESREVKDTDSEHKNLFQKQQKRIQELKNTLHDTKEEMQILQMKNQEEIISLGKHLGSLAHAASGYQKVLEENRRLYNQVQDLKGNIRVYCRIRPFLPGQSSSLTSAEGIDERTIAVLTPSKYGKAGRKSFTFNKVFGSSATQEEVFADTQPLIRSVLDGYNVCIFAYGQTGAGKTYTMTGPKELTAESVGVNYRALGDLFLISEQRKHNTSYAVSVQMMEIYNEQVRDLLAADGVNKKLEIRNNSQNGISVPNANLVPVTSTSDVINLMNIGHKNRAVSATAMNDRSSRSHSCLTVHVQGRDLTSGSVLRGCMHLVDLAGSERVDKSEAVGDTLKEAQHINRSLSALGDVIASLAQKNAHVPYRNSKLTQLLQDSLGGQAKTLMFVHISPEPDALGETLSTLNFAERVSTVELGAAKANKEGAGVKELKEQIASLKAALARKESGESGCLQHSRSCSPDKRHSLDLQNLINSPSWPPVDNPGSMEEGKGVSGDWVDKIMVNKKDSLADNNHLEMWEKDGNRRHSLDNGLVRTPYETVTDDSDELDATMSDSSELDYQSQLNIQRSNSFQNGVGLKGRKPGTKQTRIPELRSQIPQPPSRRVANGINSPLNRPIRQHSFADGKRKPATGK